VGTMSGNCPSSSGHMSAYTNNLRTPLVLRGVISLSLAVLALSGRGYAELRHNGVLRSSCIKPPRGNTILGDVPGNDAC
jgi:hypothetical protein